MLYQNYGCYGQFAHCYRTVITNSPSNISTFCFCRACADQQPEDSPRPNRIRIGIRNAKLDISNGNANDLPRSDLKLTCIQISLITSSTNDESFESSIE